MVGNKFLTCQHVIDTQAHSISILTVGAFVFRLLLGFPVLSCYYRYDHGMNVRYVLVLYFHRILMRTQKHDADYPYLIGSYLTFNICRTDTVTYRFGTVGHSTS